MKRQIIASVALALALTPLSGTSETPTPPNGSPVLQAPAAGATPQLSEEVRGVAKMASAGVSGEVIKAYIDNYPFSFNLTSDQIIQLQDNGVSGAITAAMLNHDKTLKEKTSTAPQPSQPYQPPPDSQPANTPQIATYPAADTQVVSDYQVYGGLAPYGYWNNLVGYGWCWQPYSWLAYDYYPRTWLSFGYWWTVPGRGLCWFPRSHFRDFDRFHGNRGTVVTGRTGGSWSPVVTGGSRGNRGGFVTGQPAGNRGSFGTGRTGGNRGAIVTGGSVGNRVPPAPGRPQTFGQPAASRTPPMAHQGSMGSRPATSGAPPSGMSHSGMGGVSRGGSGRSR